MNILGLKINKGDIDGFLGLFVDNLSVILLIISLNIYVIGMPSEIVYGRILPGAAVGLLLGNIYYTYLANKLTAQGQDVTALPCGISIVFAIAYTMGIIYPISKITGDPVLAWKITIAGTIIGGFICIIGAFIGPILRNFLPKAAMLGALAGIGLVFIAGGGIDDVFSNPIIGIATLAIIIWGYFARGKMIFNMPTGLFALVVGSVLAIVLKQTTIDTSSFGIYMPYPWILDIGFEAFSESFKYLGIIIPVAIINFIGTLNNVESARAVGDEYSVKNVMLADAFATILGACFGCCYPNGVFIGHPAYKRLGAKTSYSLINGIVIALLSVFGMFKFISTIVPISAVTPILIFVGIIMLEIAFVEVEKEYVSAVGISLIPFIPEFAKEQIDSALTAVNVSITPDVIAALHASGINYTGYSLLAYGTILISMYIASAVVFAISRDFKKLFIVCVFAALSTIIGLIHSPVLKLGANPELAFMWLIIAAIALIAKLVAKKETTSHLSNKVV